MTDPTSDVGSASALAVFSQASSVRPRAAGAFDAEVSGGWTIGGRPNGGYLLALLGRAASSLTDSGDLVAASAHYLRSPDPGPVEIDGEVLRRGRSMSQVRARISQGGRSCVEGLISTSELDPSAVPRWDVGVPDVPLVPFEDCIRLRPATPDGIPVAMLNQVDLRLDPESSGMMTGRPSGQGQLRGWLELLGEEGFDPISLMYAVDAFPPATFDTESACWMSTVEMTAYVRAVPAPGPVRIVSRVRLIDPQWVDQTCDVWDGTGRLVAQATQLAKVLG
jgi:acyl-coenzyme A thioesterase PaaI-like protein